MAGNIILSNANGKTITISNPDSNIDMVFQLTPDTELTIKVKGSEGVTRTANITLA